VFEQRRAQPRSVLLIDDDELIAGSLHRYLVTQGVAVDVAVDRSQAVDSMQAHRYDVVLVDPYLTGALHGDREELFDAIRHLQPRAALIVLTAYSSPELESAAADGRITTLLPKPQSIVRLGELLAAPATR
jgi:DNA-binding NtrC family response regulator